MKLGRGRFGNVISIGARAAMMNFPAISQVDAYWEGLRKGRLMPARSEVDPRGLEGALAYALLMELVAPSVARIRVSGMHLTDLLGMEVRGMPLTAFFEPKDRAKIAAAVNQVSEGPRVIEVDLTSPGGIGRGELTAKLYLAPLSSGKDGRPRILACLQAKGEIGRTPRRFQVKDMHKRRIVAAAGTAPEPNVAPSPARIKPTLSTTHVKKEGFSENAASFDRASDANLKPSERSYLRLVKSDDQL